MQVLIIDNYDSFTYNLYHYVKAFVEKVDVARNDGIAIEDVQSYSHIIISPGPGLPSDAGITPKLVSRFIQTKSILGVCLGFQALAEYYGSSLYNQKFVAHGVQEEIRWNKPSWLFKDIPETFTVGLYHSWAARAEGLDSNFNPVAHSKKGVLMAAEHKALPVAGVQFHPESIMTEFGKKIIENWLNR